MAIQRRSALEVVKENEPELERGLRLHQRNDLKRIEKPVDTEVVTGGGEETGSKDLPPRGGEMVGR